MKTLIIRSSARIQMIDITNEINKRLQGNGVCLVFVPHTTAAVTVNENLDHNVVEDMIKVFNKIVPRDMDYAHLEGNSQAHILSTLIGSSIMLPFENGHLKLGQWQGVFFVELDGPRTRKVHIKVV